MNRWQKKGKNLFTVLFAILCLALSGDVWAEEISPLAGGPQEGKGRKPDNPGGTTKGDVLGDLWVVVRNVTPSGDGEPTRFTWTWSDACWDSYGVFNSNLTGCYPESYDYVGGKCVQPITQITYLPEEFYYLPAPLAPPVYDATGAEKNFPYEDYINSEGKKITVNLIPLDPECNIPEKWGDMTVEVDSGRLALARTTDYVITDAYNETIAVINSAVWGDLNEDGTPESPPVTLDAAGRLLLTLLDGDGNPYLKTVDSPRENLALYQRLMLTIQNGKGCLEGISDNIAANLGNLSHLACTATSDDSKQDLLRAASFLAGAADKSGDITIDEVIYLNSILEINTIQEDGDNLVVTGYFDFKDTFTYERSDAYAQVKSRLLQPGSELINDYPTTFTVDDNVSIYEKVFGVDWSNSLYPIVNFVRSSDDALNVITYIHNYALPVYLILDTNTGNLTNRSKKMPMAPVRSLAE